MNMNTKNYLLAAAMLGSGMAMAGQPEVVDGYLDTAYGRNPYVLPEPHTHALRSAMHPLEQHVRRYPGVATHERVLQRSRGRELTLGGWEFLPAKPQKFMPYLDGLFVPGNTAVEPSWWVKDDMLSHGAQQVKSMLSRYGLQYSLTLSMGYAGVVPPSSAGRNDFVSTDNSLSGVWYLLKKQDNSQGLFLSFEADWGQGIRFNERRAGVQNTIGSLSDPQASLRGGNGVYIPHLALGYSLADGKWVGMVGTIDTSSYLDQNTYSASWNGNLMNSAFTCNPCLPLPWANFGFLTAWQPCKSFYALYATTGTEAGVNQNPFRHISSDSWVHVSEFGWITEDFLGLGPGVYRFQYTITDHEGRTGSGAAINIQQQLGKDSQLGWFARCGVMDTDAAAVNNVKAAVTTGLVLQAPFSDSGWGSKANHEQLAFGFMWARAADSYEPCHHRNEYGLELSAVIQVTPTFFIQPDVQYIFNPAGQTDRSGEFVFQLQGVFKF